MGDMTFSSGNSREKVYTEKQQYILDNVARKYRGDALAAAIGAGYEHPKAAIKTLTKELIEIANEILAQSSIKAALTLEEIVTSNDVIPNIKEKIAVAKEILEHTNPKNIKVDVGDSQIGLFILPAKGSLDGK